MHSIKRASSYVAIAACLVLAAGGSVRQANGQAAAPQLDYQTFKEKVAPFHLVPLSPGATTWNEQQSRQNFELVQKVAVPGYEDSRILKHPLAAPAGDGHHGGGQQFASENDPDWQTLKAWVMGAK